MARSPFVLKHITSYYYYYYYYYYYLLLLLFLFLLLLLQLGHTCDIFSCAMIFYLQWYINIYTTFILLQAEIGTSKPITKPEPPRKVSKDKQDSASNPDADSPKLEPKAGPRPSPRPKKQLPAAPVATADIAHTEVSEEPPAEVKVMPTVKPRPVPPRAKPRTPSISLQNSLESSETSSKEGPAPPPQPKPRRSLSPEEEVVPPQPAKKPRPVPVPRKPEGPKPAKDDDEQVNNAGEEAKKEDDAKSEIAKNKETEVSQENENKEEVTRDSSLDDELQKEAKKDIQQDDMVDDKMDDKIPKEPEICYSEVTNGVVNSDHEPQPGGKEEPQGKEDESYEDMDYDKESTKQSGDSSKGNGQNQFAYVEMSTGVADSSQDQSNEYEPVEVIVNEDEDKNDYEIPQDWNEPTVASARSSGGFVPMVLKPSLTDEQMAIYDVPPTPRPAIQDDRPSSSATGDSITSQSQEAASRSNSVASSISLSSKNSANSPVLRLRTRSQEGNPTAAVSVTNSTSNLEQRIESLEDSIEV